ncbi:MAG: HTTM domain-containing protein [Flavobacteriales bacterium]|nr:HTTM domain-containing protein [Flavobacteriales bacterium]
MLNKILVSLFTKESPITLATFRVLAGLTMSYSFLTKLLNTELKRYFSSEFNHFPYCGFEWVQPLTYNGINVLLAAITLGFAFLALGLFYRYVTWFLLVSVSYFYLLDSSVYNNHYYFIVLLLGFFCVTDANAIWSIDSTRNRSRAGYTLIAKWQRLLFGFQVSVVYFYGGLAKLHLDWLTGRITRADLTTTYGQLLSETQLEILTQTFTWGGLVFDLAVPFLLISRTTRRWAFVPILLFHAINEARFEIGIFPMLMFSATILFFSPEELRSYLSKLFKSIVANYQVITEQPNTRPIREYTFVILGLALFCGFQLIFPLRHYFDGRDILWSKVGYTFSWHMKMSHEVTESHFYITNKGGVIQHEISKEDYMGPRQAHSMHVYPVNTLRFASWIEKDLKELYIGDVEVRTDFRVGLNGRPGQQWADSTVNLLNECHSICNCQQDWILKKPF